LEAFSFCSNIYFGNISVTLFFRSFLKENYLQAASRFLLECRRDGCKGSSSCLYWRVSAFQQPL